MSKTVRTRYVPVRTSIWLEKYVLLASSTYFYHAFCTQYVLSTYCFRKVRTRYAQGKNSTYLVRTWGKKYVPVQSSTRWYSTIDEYNSVRTSTFRVRTTVHDSRWPGNSQALPTGQPAGQTKKLNQKDTSAYVHCSTMSVHFMKCM